MITIQDLTTRFGEAEMAELTDREAFAVIDEKVANRAINDAESEVESYLNSVGLVSRNRLGNLVYSKATNPPKSLIIKICDIARYYLHEDGVTGIVEERYKQAIDWLKLVMKNPTMLTGISDIETSATANSGVFVMPSLVPSLWDN